MRKLRPALSRLTTSNMTYAKKVLKLAGTASRVPRQSDIKPPTRFPTELTDQTLFHLILCGRADSKESTVVMARRSGLLIFSASYAHGKMTSTLRLAFRAVALSNQLRRLEVLLLTCLRL